MNVSNFKFQIPDFKFQVPGAQLKLFLNRRVSEVNAESSELFSKSSVKNSVPLRLIPKTKAAPFEAAF